MTTSRLTTAQAIIRFLKNQYVQRDGRENKFFAGMLGIFGHGNVAGIGQALQENAELIHPAIFPTSWCATSSQGCTWPAVLPK